MWHQQQPTDPLSQSSSSTSWFLAAVRPSWTVTKVQAPWSSEVVKSSVLGKAVALKIQKTFVAFKTTSSPEMSVHFSARQCKTIDDMWLRQKYGYWTELDCLQSWSVSSRGKLQGHTLIHFIRTLFPSTQTPDLDLYLLSSGRSQKSNFGPGDLRLSCQEVKQQHGEKRQVSFTPAATSKSLKSKSMKHVTGLRKWNTKNNLCWCPILVDVKSSLKLTFTLKILTG